MALRSGAAASPVDRMSAMGPGIAGSQMPSSLHQQHQQQQPPQPQPQPQPQQHQGAMQHSQSPSSGSALAQVRRTQKLELSGVPGDQFPIGLRVLVVDDDMCCLRVVDQMLKMCGYQVTTCPLATKALELLRTNKDAFDLVISDVHMPDMDGFKLLELVGLEMDLPVIMMSANGETAQVMKGVTHGACDYLLKPVRQAELSNIWQHVVRKKRNENKDAEQSGSLEDDRHKKGADDGDLTSSVNDAADGNWKLSKKRKDAKEDDDDNEQDNDDPSTLKKPRVVWSVELHQQFVSAVNKLGIEKAVPKRILELMSVHGLTRENVASHLQKYRLYLKRLSGVTHTQGNPYGGAADPFGPMAALDGVGDLRALAAAAQLTPQGLAALQANVLNRMNPGPNGMGLGGLDSSVLLHMSQGGNAGHLSRRVPQHMLNLHMQGVPNALDLDSLCQPQQLSMGLAGPAPLEDVAGLTAALQHQLATAGGLSGMGTVGGMNGSLSPNPNNNALMMQLLQQQQQQLQNSHSEVGANVSLQGGGLLGQHMLPSDMNLGRAGPLPSLTAVNACLGDGSGLPSLAGSRGLGVPPISTGCAMSNTLSALVRPSIEGKLGGGQQPFPCVSSVPSSPVGLVSPSAMKDLSGGLGSITDCLTSKPVVRGNSGTNFTPLGNLSRGLGQSLNSNNRPNWQSHGPGLGGPDFSQPLSPVINGPHQRYAQMNAPAQEMNAGFVRGQGFLGQGVPYSGRLSVDTSGAISLSEQSTADSDMKLKDERAVDSIFSAKLDGGLMAHRDDDLLGMFMEQVSRAPLF